MKNYFVFWIWSAFLFMVVIGLGLFTTQDKIYKGTDIEFIVSASHNLTINASSEVTFKGASRDIFLLRKLDGDVIVASSSDPPLGWNSDEYFTAGPRVMEVDTWIVEKGTFTVKLVSNQSMTVRVYDNKESMTWLQIVLAIVPLWLVGEIYILFLF